MYAVGKMFPGLFPKGKTGRPAGTSHSDKFAGRRSKKRCHANKKGVIRSKSLPAGAVGAVQWVPPGCFLM